MAGDFLSARTKAKAKLLNELRLVLEKEHQRKFTDHEVAEVANFLQLMADMTVRQFLNESKWKDRLKEHPEGYKFEPEGYTCRLCRQGASKVGTWFDRYGLKCMHCQKAVEAGLIPGELTDFSDGYYTDGDLERLFNVDRKTLTSWIKNGVIRARVIPWFDDPSKNYKRLFLLTENADFSLKKKCLNLTKSLQRK
ncbi:hypothetical protein ACQKCH_04090 [Nubsella zeaxanthinifaciens]|uniref:hypothetical protein n=1 Tax=Nubsella zeaxanthinifaciens TaxID=392412 RepID=UPI003D0667FD